MSCTEQTRTEEREITVIDTPGVMDAAAVREITGMTRSARYSASAATNGMGRGRKWLAHRDVHEKTLRELSKMASYAPRGLNAILLIAEFGCRFTQEDYSAFQMLLKFFGGDAKKYMILLLTHGDDAEYIAGEKGITVDEHLKNWIDNLDEWLKNFVHHDLEARVVLFKGRLKPDQEPQPYKKQLCKLIEVNC